MSTRYQLDFGAANTGGSPSFSAAGGFFKRLDTLADITPPALTEIPGGTGVFYFDWEWSGLDYSAISFKATLNGSELTDVITSGGYAPGATAAGAGQWTREDCIAFVKHLLFEDAATTSIASVANMQTTIDVANRKVWGLAVKTAPTLFEARSADLTYVASTGYYDLTSLESGNGFHLLGRVYLKVSGNYYNLEPFTNNERLRAAPEGLQGVTPLGYYLEGERLYLAPKPSENQTLQLSYIPHPGTLTTGSALIGGVRALSLYHPLVAYEAALMLGVKDEAELVGTKLLRDELRAQMVQHLSRRQLRRPRSIREVPFR